MLTDQELIDRLRGGLSVLEPRADLFDELVRQTHLDRLRSRALPGTRRRGRRLASGLVLAASVLVVVIVGAAALRLTGHRSASAPEGATTRVTQPLAGRDLAALKRAFPFLLRPQTPADRTASPAQAGFAMAVSRAPRATLWATLAPVPTLTRLVTSEGVTVRVFVARVVVTRVRPASAASLPVVRRAEARLPRYELLGQTAGRGAGSQVLYDTRSGQLTAFTAPGHRIFALVPTGVARVRWSWPRLFNPVSLAYDPPGTLNTTVRDNLAVGVSDNVTPPPVAEWFNTAGQETQRLTNPDAAGAQFGPGRDRPGPETTLTRKAEQDPATPNRIAVLPAPQAPTSAQHNSFLVLFHVLIQGAKYGVHITGGPHPGCIHLPYPYERTGRLGGIPAPRGGTFQGILPMAGSCPGTYTLNVYVRQLRGHTYPPFGTAQLTVK